MGVEAVVVALAAFAGSLVSGLGGFGGSFIIVIVLTPFVGAKSVIPLIAVYAICANISRVAVYRRSIVWKPAVQFTMASLPGVVLGTRFLKEIPDVIFLGFMGATLILILPTRRYLKSRTFRPGLKTLAGLGLFFGFISGTAAGSGMFVIAFFNCIGLSGPRLLGTDAVIGLVNAITRSGAFLGLGLLDTHLVLLGMFMGIMTVPGTWVASQLVARMGTRIHDRLIEILIAAAGFFFISHAILHAAQSEAEKVCGHGINPITRRAHCEDRKAWLRPYIPAASCQLVNAGMACSLACQDGLAGWRNTLYPNGGVR
ncbi:MAG: sulfite exporter TauE/SafE family protein [Rhodobacteraceae bacterium]|nr:sulfite exporter TauE/SafE family protein [Paracoccaceae bacterium]